MENQRIGEISEWNEGNLKSLRLHEAQEMINFAKINPLNKIPQGKGWNFELWISGINILFGEGSAKYTEKEIKEVNKIKLIIEQTLHLKPIYKSLKNNQKKDSYIYYPKNWDILKQMIELYEQSVKFYNDKHGLSTRNQGTGGLF